jgi:hypothetical protein
MTRWNLFQNGVSGTKEPDLIDITTVESANPFGDYAVARIDDAEGSNYAEYTFGTRIDASIESPPLPDLAIAPGETVTTQAGTTDKYGATVSNAGTYRNKGTVTNIRDEQVDFSGFVVERRENDESGSDVLEVEAYSFDQFLRRNDVSLDQSGNLVSEAIERIIRDDTPVTYDPALINVQNDVQLTRSLQGENVETALRVLSDTSENEAFGVNQDLEFFFRPRESKHIDRGIDNTQWFNYDLPERGKEAINEVEVRFNNGNQTVVVGNQPQKKTLQDNLDLDGPGTQRKRIARPNITATQDARAEGERFLKFRNATLSGTITTYGLYNASPFDTINVEIIDRGIDTEFIITEVKKNWARDETTLTVVENRGFDEDFIVRLSEKTERIDLRDTDEDAQQDRIIKTDIPVVFDIQATLAEAINADDLFVSNGTTESVSAGATRNIDGTVSNAGTFENAGTVRNTSSAVTASTVKLTNAGRNKIRDAWRGEDSLEITDIVVGTDNSGLSRSNTTLRQQTNSNAVSQTVDSETTVLFTAPFDDANITEVGLTDSSGTVIARAVVDSPVDVDGDVTFEITVQNDTENEDNILTTTGLTAVRDILLNQAPAPPSEYVFGTGDDPPTESDTSLTNEEYRASLARLEIQQADTTTDWQDITSIQNTDPLIIENGKLKLAQSAFFFEAENNNGGGGGGAISDSLASESEAESLFVGEQFDQDGNLISDGHELNFTANLDYTIPEDHVAVAFRFRNPNDPDGDGTFEGATGEVLVDGTSFGTAFGFDFNDKYDWNKETNYSGGDISGSTKVTINVQNDAPSGARTNMDAVVLYDDRFTYTFDNTVDSNNHLSGPEPYPDKQDIRLDNAVSQVNSDEVFVTTNWNNVSNNQEIRVGKQGDTTPVVQSNTQTFTHTFTELSAEWFVEFQLSRYGTRDTQSPTTGFKEQTIDTHLFEIDPDQIQPDAIGQTTSRAIVDNPVQGVVLTESGQVTDTDTLLTHSVFAEVELADTINNLISAETIIFQPSN